LRCGILLAPPRNAPRNVAELAVPGASKEILPRKEWSAVQSEANWYQVEIPCFQPVYRELPQNTASPW
jgi:hypothetical protein